MGSEPTCACGRRARLVSGVAVYGNWARGRDVEHKKFWLCAPCDAYVGTHPNRNHTPLGPLADAPTRLARRRAHAAFDPLWRGRDKEARRREYAWLGKALGISAKECHIGHMDVARCQRVVDVVNARLRAEHAAALGEEVRDGE